MPDDSSRAGRATVIGQAEFRTVLGHFASGVVIVTGQSEAGPAGLTCQSFFSLSIDPPLVAFAPSVISTSWPPIEAAGTCTVNVLGAGQEALARGFSRTGTDKFDGVGWTPASTGAVRLNDALAWLDCQIESVLDGGDHRIVVARVVELALGGGDPLVFYRGGFGTFKS